MNNNKYTKVLSYFMAFLILLLLQPSFYWDFITSWSPYITILLLSYFWLNIERKDSTDLIFFFLFAAILLIAAITKNSNIFGTVIFLSMTAIPFISINSAKNIYKCFKSIFSLILFISLLIYLLVLVKVPIHYEIIAPLNSVKEYSYFSYPFLLIPKVPDFSLLNYRFHGPFDEPGVIGTIGILILFIEKFNLRKKENIIILIAGLLTFSLFFYISLLFYLIFTSNKKFSILSLMILLLISYYTFQNDFLYEMIWNRFSWDSSRNTLTGDNRTSSSLDNYYNQIKGTTTYYWGGASKQTISNFEESASYKNAILSYGFVPCFMYIMFFIFLAYYRLSFSKSFVLFVFIFLATLYQRPGFFYIYYVLFFSLFTLQIPKELKHISKR